MAKNFNKVNLIIKTKLTSSREINSLLCVKPGINPRFFIQKIAAKLPEKNIPSTAAKAIRRSAKVALSLDIQRSAQSAFFRIQSILKIALNRRSL